MYTKTPILKYQEHERNFYFKMDCDQPSGSFKLRGMTKLINSKVEEGVNRFISSSGGNAGYSAAMVCKELGKEIKVIVPSSTPSKAIEMIARAGAEVEVYGNSWPETDLYARSQSEKEQAFYIHPFDHPLIWEGHKSIITECLSEIEKPDVVVLSVGGGGLFCGVIQGIIDNKWENTPVICCETDGTASMAACLKQKEWVEINKINSIASTLGATKIARQAFEYCMSNSVYSWVMSDKTALQAKEKFHRQTGKTVEVACGAALSVVYENAFPEFKNVLVIVCGGIGG